MSEERKGKLSIYLGTEKDRMVLPNGEEYLFFPLDLTDVGDLEEHFGSDFAKAMGKTNTKVALYILWLAVRKNGLTQEQILAQQWKISERQAGMWFPVNEIGKLLQIVPRIFSLSGLEPDSKNARGGLPPARTGEK